MKNYFEMLDKTIKEYFKILSDEIPDFLNEYLKHDINLGHLRPSKFA